MSEKIKISDHASVGLYYFKKWKDFKNVFVNHQEEIINKYKEVYVCPMYQYLIDNNKIIKINNFLKYLLIIIGVLGCGIYFILPTLIILLGDFISLIMIIINKIPRKEKDNTKDTNSIKDNVEYSAEERLIITKNEIAMNLLEKDSDINFICDITGFSKDYIKKLKKEALVSNNEK